MFEVGKEVVCVKSHSDGAVTKGQHFVLQGITKAKCLCGGLDLDVGIRVKAAHYHQLCTICGQVSDIGITNIHWFSSTNFAPIDNTLSDTTDADILNEIEELEEVRK